MRTIVVDDEPWMLKRFAIECDGIPDVQLLGSFRSSLKALDFAHRHPVELAFLDVEMPEINGIELANKLREINPQIIIVFISAYDSETFKSSTADLYIMKPYSAIDIEAAINHAKILSLKLCKSIFARTFGVFELFADNKPVAFQDNKAKELLALLIDRNDDILSVTDATSLLWPELSFGEGKTNFQRALKCLYEDLSALHIESVFEKSNSSIFIHANLVDCDLYKFLDGAPEIIQQYSGEYMLGYDWAEERRITLLQQRKQIGLFHDSQTQKPLCANIRTLDDPQLTIRYMNDNFLTLVGYTREEIEKRFQNSLRAMVLREDFDCVTATVRKLFETRKATEVKYRLTGKNGKEVLVICKSEPPKTIFNNTHEISSVLTDISETQVKHNNIEQTTTCDNLTGLYNRSFAQAKIQQYLESTDSTQSGALILMDVDNFKDVNDTYGHQFADTVLTDIASILTRSFRSSDIVCRLEGDEMMIFLRNIGCEDNARKKLKSASESLHKRLSAKTRQGEISCSFGGAMCPQNGCDFETLYSNANIALYKAEEKKNLTVWFSEAEDAGDKK